MVKEESLTLAITYFAKVVRRDGSLGPISWAYCEEKNHPTLFGSWPKVDTELKQLAKELQNNITVAAKSLFNWLNHWDQEERRWTACVEDLSLLAKAMQELNLAF